MSAPKRDPRKKAGNVSRLYPVAGPGCWYCRTRDDLLQSAHMHRREMSTFDRAIGRKRTYRSRRRYWNDAELVQLSAVAQSDADFYFEAAALADGSGHPRHVGSALASVDAPLKAEGATDGR